MFKKIFYLILLSAAGVAVWFTFAIWTGYYSVYSIPPSSEDPKGRTLVVSREPGEPMFDSPNVKPAKKPQDPEQKGGMGFGAAPKGKKPIADRIIIRLPYIEWAYKKSLEPQEP
jgi:hypothetical protein